MSDTRHQCGLSRREFVTGMMCVATAPSPVKGASKPTSHRGHTLIAVTDRVGRPIGRGAQKPDSIGIQSGSFDLDALSELIDGRVECWLKLGIYGHAAPRSLAREGASLREAS
ncbi:MAG: hypothetical protein JWO52_7383 [Gammaproteobacteria bacterium]|nr:hypothetical protein [Gammaproteobacteria bacterium]